MVAFWLIFLFMRYTLFEIFIFCPKIQLWFPEKIVDFFFGWKTRENVVVLDFLGVDNFDFTRKIVIKKLGEKAREDFGDMSKLNFCLDIFEYFIFKESGISACWNDCSSLGQSWISYIRPDSARKIGGLVHDFQFHIDGKSQVCISLGSHFRLLVISNFFFTHKKDEGELSKR